VPDDGFLVVLVGEGLDLLAVAGHHGELGAGQRAGAEVAQVYVADHHAPVPRPPKELKGFAKVALAPGETKRVQIPLDRRALSFFDVKTKRWRAEPGTFEVLVGSSSRQIELRGKLTLR